jgi:hypothetical protein
VTATLPQTLALLALSRGSYQFRSPQLRRSMLRRQWIVPDTYELTAAGHEALAASPFLSQAQRGLNGPPMRMQVASGYRSDSVKRSVRK